MGTTAPVIRLDSKRCILEGDGKLHKIKPISEKGEKGGDGGDPVAARDYVLDEIPISEKQLDAIMGERFAAAMFNQKPDQPLQFLWDSFGSIQIKNRKYKNCGITFHVEETNSDSDIEIKNGVRITLVSVKLTGGTVRACAKLRVKLTAVFPRKLATLDLEERLGDQIRVSMRLGSLEEVDADAQKERQTDLVNKAQDEADEERERSSRKTNGDDAHATH